MAPWLLRDVADRGDRRNVAILLRRFERDDHWASARTDAIQLVEVGDIVVPEEESLRTDGGPLDHRIVVERVREDRAVRQQPSSAFRRGKVRIHPDVKIKSPLAMKVGHARLRARMCGGPGDVSVPPVPAAETGRCIVQGGSGTRELPIQR